ncbi:hypothetical protein EVAR_93174_1 [Eumeta japonica]|uniref:Uncharacterized protein n=1 Tax=Eumeta variegata TaxID=151549 RepID=A0A4C1TGI3_EUMVA|nr:hypothetical protein EVAR_93174_1 [Eumeta japonica]
MTTSGTSEGLIKRDRFGRILVFTRAKRRRSKVRGFERAHGSPLTEKPVAGSDEPRYKWKFFATFRTGHRLLHWAGNSARWNRYANKYNRDAAPPISLRP